MNRKWTFLVLIFLVIGTVVVVFVFFRDLIIAKDYLQMTLEAESTVVVGESTKINVTLKNTGTKEIIYYIATPLAPSNALNIEKIGGGESYYSLHYRWIDLFTGIGTIQMVQSIVIEPKEEVVETYYAKFFEAGEYNITATFMGRDDPASWGIERELSRSLTINVDNADDVNISLSQATNVSSIEDLELVSLIRSESLNRPVWLLRSGYPYSQIVVDGVYGNSSEIPDSLRHSWQILEMLEYQSPDKYMEVIIGATIDFTPAMIEQLEELGAKHVTVLGKVIAKDVVSALIPCDYNKIIKIAQLDFVYNLDSLMSISNA